MPKDFKIGMIIGLILVITATLCLAIHPSLSPTSIMQETFRSGDAAPPQETSGLPNNHSPQDAYRRTTKSTAESSDNNQLSIINDQSKLPDFTVHEQAERIKTTKFHIVRKGETLSALSSKYYGSANKWQKILDANRSQVTNANTLKPGTKLIIPE